MKDWVILTLNKPAHLNMSNVENDLDIYYAVGNANTQRQESEIAAIIKKKECFWMETDLNKYDNLRH